MAKRKKKRGYVSPELAQKILDRADKKWEYCGGYKQIGDFPHAIHHIVGRKVDADEHNLTYLCDKCHKEVHAYPNSSIDLELKLNLQDTYYEIGFPEDEVRALMSGKIY